MEALIEILDRFGSQRIVLMGDFMLDRYVYGDAERISPEAPVPVLRRVRQEDLIGGAGNVVQAIVALGGKVASVGVVGKDDDGKKLKGLLDETGANTSQLVRLADWPTTVKTRYVGLAQHRHAQQMFRVDAESPQGIDDKVRANLRSAVRSELQNCKVLALEDYNKGVFSNAHTPQVIADARKVGLTVVVDPARVSDYRRYRGATLLVPNRYEAELAAGEQIRDDESLARAARKIRLATDAEAVVITLDKEGAYLCEGDGPGRRIATRPRSVYDVSGAGDEVLAMLALAMGAGCDLPGAVALANVAGGLAVERFGVVPVTRWEVIDELRSTVGLRGGKVVDRARLKDELARRRRRDQTVVFTNGCFDLLHVGHVRYLRQARELGTCLVVAINSDDSVRRLKGPGRPVIPADERAEMLGALECVDYVTIFDEDTPQALLGLLKPELLVKGGATPVVVGREIVEGYGGTVRTLELVDGLSTTDIINRVVNDGGGE